MALRSTAQGVSMSRTAKIRGCRYSRRRRVPAILGLGRAAERHFHRRPGSHPHRRTRLVEAGAVSRPRQGCIARPPGTTRSARVTVCDPDGKVVARFGGPNPILPGNFIAPHGLWCDSRGDLYVGEVVVRGGAVALAPLTPQASRNSGGRGREPGQCCPPLLPAVVPRPPLS